MACVLKIDWIFPENKINYIRITINSSQLTNIIPISVIKLHLSSHK